MPSHNIRELAAQYRGPAIASVSTPFVFQVMDIQERIVHDYKQGPEELKFSPNPVHDEICSDGFFAEINNPVDPGPRYDEEKCMLLLMGADEKGNSVCLQVRYSPYCYVQIPDDWTSDTDFVRFMDALKTSNIRQAKYVYERRHHLSGWQSDFKNPLQRRMNNYLKLHFPSMKHLRQCEYVLQKPLYINGKRYTFPIWESGIQRGAIPVKTKFVDDLNLIVGGWITVAEVTAPEHGYCSTCQIEVQASGRHIKSIADKIDMAPLLIVSVDGEMYSKRHRFPDPSNETDCVIGIGVSVARLTDDPTKSSGFYFALELSGQDVPPEVKDYTLLPFKNEHELIEAYRDFLVLLDPDIVLGYNTSHFDWWYLGNRVPQNSRFFYQGRIAAQHTPLVADGPQKKKSNNDEEEEEEEKKCLLHMPGRLQIDMLAYIKKNFKLRDYKLTTVSQYFLKDDKLDLHAEEMFQAFEDGMRGCLKIAAYCVQDTRLPLRLMHHIMTIPNLIEMGRVTSTLPQDLIDRGQTFRLCNFFFREARKNQFVFTKFDDTTVPDYEGATVIPPKIGFYDNFVVTLDFASLYPSILIDNNLSHDTYILPDDVDDDRIKKLPINTVGEDHFVKHEEGVLAKMEKQLLALRRKVRKEMKDVKDKARYQMMDARQLTLKLVCNALYGFTANAMNWYNCPAVGRSITMLGRGMIETTRQLVEKMFNSTVLYGDTDSVFILFHAVKTLEEAFKLGKEAAEYVTKHFGGNAIELTMEKVLRPFLSLAKKRYAGIKFDSLEDKGKLYSKGLETVRRDVSPFVAKTYESILEAIVKKKDVILAQEALHKRLCDLEDNKIPLEEFEISVSMKSTYKSVNLPQLTVVRKMKERNPGSEPTAGDRFTYVVIENPKATGVSEQAEDPAYVKAGNAKIDRLHYLKALMTPISNLFRAFTDDCSILFRRTEQTLIRQRDKAQDISLFVTGGAAVERKMPQMPPKTEAKPEKPDHATTASSAIDSFFKSMAVAAPASSSSSSSSGPKTPRRRPPVAPEPPKKKRKTTTKQLKTVELDVGRLFGKK